MLITFNMILERANIDPEKVRLLRHKDSRASKGRSPYELWRDANHKFVDYQSTQKIKNRTLLSADYWASFVANRDGETLFAGLYASRYIGLLPVDRPMPHIVGGIDLARSCDLYDLVLEDALGDLIGKLVIEWGPGKLAWAQYALNHDKPVIELRASFKEPDFPGYLNFIENLSKCGSLPVKWIAALRLVRGVYLLTCPESKLQYVGSASGEDGFWGRWQSYLDGGDGGNKGLIAHGPSDYQVSILEVAGSKARKEDIADMEGLWQRKLQSREMGLNKNIASGSDS